MLYLVVILILFLFVIIFFAYRRKNEKEKDKERIIYKWAKVVKGERNQKLISSFHNSLNSESLSDEIAADIDLDKVFSFVDRTNSKPGQQLLYHKLKSNKRDINALNKLDDLTTYFEENPTSRLTIEIELDKIGDANAYYIHELFTTNYSTLYNRLTTFYIKIAGLLLLFVIFLNVFYINQLAFVLALGLVILNFYFHYTNKKKVARYIHSLPQLYLLINAAKNILKFNKVEDVQQSILSLGALQRSLSYVNFQNKVNRDPTDIGDGILELIKALFVIEPLMFLVSIDRINQQKKNIAILFNYVAEIDVAISTASLRAGLPFYAKPDFTENGKAMNIDSLYHPLVDDCVTNSINVAPEQGVLITGSNMSGKTTFIRSLAINTLIAQTLFTSFTKVYEAPFLQLFTSIRLSDDLEEHKSYFQSEALSILNIVKNTSTANNSLIIIDEIFRGTNTIERVSAAKAILSYLTANQNFTFVSTHDLELAELLGSEYAVYSFEEVVTEAKLFFDYKIKPGILKNKNAITILSAMGYPSSIIENANETINTLRKKYDLM